MGKRMKNPIPETTCGKVFATLHGRAPQQAGLGPTRPFCWISSPCKMKLKNANDKRAIYCGNTVGPTFGNGCDTNVDGSIVCLHPGRSYDHGPVIPNGSYTTYTIKEMEVFLVTKSSTHPIRNSYSKGNQTGLVATTRFSDDMNKAINAKQACLLQAESEMLQLEESFTDEQTFVDKFATGDAKDVVVLNVSGTVMTTKRCTLCTVEDSVLAQHSTVQ